MFSFMGAEIVSQVVRDLIPLGLENASSLLLAGSSAGGIGVMLNLDHVQNLVHQELGLLTLFHGIYVQSPITILQINLHSRS